jgi:glycogen synthase
VPLSASTCCRWRPLLRDRRLVAVGVLVTIVASVALVAGLADAVTPSTVTGVGAGLLLLAFAVAELAGALRNRA